MTTDLWSKHCDSIAGVWKCVSFHFYDTSGPERKLLNDPHGNAPLEWVQMSRHRCLSALASVPGFAQSPMPSGKALQLGDDAEIAHVARSWGMYCGRFELLEDDKGLYWQTRVEIAMDPSRVGGIEERRVEAFEEGGKSYLILKPTQNIAMQVSISEPDFAYSSLTIGQDGRETTADLKWERVE